MDNNKKFQVGDIFELQSILGHILKFRVMKIVRNNAHSVLHCQCIYDCKNFKKNIHIAFPIKENSNREEYITAYGPAHKIQSVYAKNTKKEDTTKGEKEMLKEPLVKYSIGDVVCAGDMVGKIRDIKLEQLDDSNVYKPFYYITFIAYPWISHWYSEDEISKMPRPSAPTIDKEEEKENMAKFEIDDIVSVKEKNNAQSKIGKIVDTKITNVGTKYLVEFNNNDEVQSDWFNEDALSETSENLLSKTEEENIKEDGKNNDYQRGMKDAWELARKLTADNDETKEFLKYFSMPADEIIQSYSIKEVQDRLKKYQDSMPRVNDVAKHLDTGEICIVTHIDSKMNTANILLLDGSTGYVPLKSLKKTGKSVSLSELLAQVQL